MIRTCDGTDPNLTREIRVDDYDPKCMTLSPWNRSRQSGFVIIQCECGLTFDDVYHEVIYSHRPVRPRIN